MNIIPLIFASASAQLRGAYEPFAAQIEPLDAEIKSVKKSTKNLPRKVPTSAVALKLGTVEDPISYSNRMAIGPSRPLVGGGGSLPPQYTNRMAVLDEEGFAPIDMDFALEPLMRMAQISPSPSSSNRMAVLDEDEPVDMEYAHSSQGLFHHTRTWEDDVEDELREIISEQVGRPWTKDVRPWPLKYGMSRETMERLGELVQKTPKISIHWFFKKHNISHYPDCESGEYQKLNSDKVWGERDEDGNLYPGSSFPLDRQYWIHHFCRSRKYNCPIDIRSPPRGDCRTPTAGEKYWTNEDASQCYDSQQEEWSGLTVDLLPRSVLSVGYWYNYTGEEVAEDRNSLGFLKCGYFDPHMYC